MNDEQDMNTTKVMCADCGIELRSEETGSEKSTPCPTCGSVKRNLTLSITEQMQPAHDILTGKLKDKRFPSKKNPRVEFTVGDDQRKSDGKWMLKTRTINKEKNQYSEVVTDPETGAVVHKCEQPLSQHIGHGSAKKKKLSNQASEVTARKLADPQR